MYTCREYDCLSVRNCLHLEVYPHKSYCLLCDSSNRHLKLISEQTVVSKLKCRLYRFMNKL